MGAATETEMKEKKDRVEDALNATRAAVEKGIVPGGVAYLRTLKVLGKAQFPGEEQLGSNLIKRAPWKSLLGRLPKMPVLRAQWWFSALWRVKGVLDLMPRQGCMRIL